ncbi:GLPGLI family protein [Chryseobacterium caseinilyticum]|uniref:GLPGLI family protein n=1 Tax=Chryseobacterium caseinilyticum TaxID=2771428 RepID=A0ABR8Z7J8_9FLAO|nr:GLPGLI family protein [Chryseobacterium caseinilyticum]MBD8081278.1 GLPGLI family protein [Chryseobacterium caseinilyticum]
MKYFLAIFLLAFTLHSAQTKRFFYDLKYKSDSTQEDYRKKIMVLDINPNETKYYDYSFLEKDSLNKATNQTNTSWTDQIPVIRKKNSGQNINFQRVEFQIYSFPTTDKVNWKLSQETKKYAEYTIQKATTNFGGREWTAWFTKEIPLSEGPYKFTGLPGLVVLLKDSNDQFDFSLVKSINLPETYDTSNILEVRYGNSPLSITEKKFTAKKIEYFNDPFHEMREKLRDGTTKSFDNNGVRYTSSTDLIPKIKEEQEYILRHNNPIELNKAIKYSVK